MMLKMILGLLAIASISNSQELIINESMSKNTSAVFDEDGSSPDWIEIYNKHNDSLDMINYYLSDDRGQLNKWQFPNGILSPNEHLLVFASDKDRTLWPKGDWVPIINFGANWNYTPGSTNISTQWNTLDFDDTAWPIGSSSIGYGDGDDMTSIEPVISIFMRKTFQVDNINNIVHGLLHMDYDDGFVAYINGNEIIRENLGISGSEVLFDQHAETNVEAKIYQGLKPEKFLIDNVQDYLVQGENVLALQVHNASENLTDLTALPILSFFYTNPPLPNETTEIKIRINTDNYPSETSWTLKAISGEGYVIGAEVPGSMSIPNHNYEWSYNVPQGDYQFTIMDTWGDGICCEDGIPIEVYNNDFESDGGWSVWPTDINSSNWNQAQGEGHNDSYKSLELYGSTSTGYVAFWQEVGVVIGTSHYLEVFAKHNSDNPMLPGQSAYAKIEFWGWGFFGPYIISEQITNTIDNSSEQDTWHKLSASAVAPEGALNTHVVVVYNNPSGANNGSVFFDNVIYNTNVHSSDPTFYSPGNYSIFIDGSQIINGGSFTDIHSDTMNTLNFFTDLLDFQDPYLHTNFKISSNGETIYLSDQDFNIIDSLFVPNMDKNISYGYQNDGDGALVLFSDPTPEASNDASQGYYGYTSEPVFSDSGGFKENYFNLFLMSETEDATIYYTTDGSKPDINSNLYNNFISINNTLLTNGTQTPDDYGLSFNPTYNGIIIRAIAVAPNYIQSRVITHSYIFDEVNTTLPIISIAIAPNDLWGPNIGMHVAGNSFYPWYPYYGSNFWEDWEKEAHIEFFEPGGEIGFKQDLGMKIFGGWSRAEAQKSFSFFARSVYGKGEIDYKLFPDSDIDSYETFILRAHGQDNVMFRDGFHTSLASENGVGVQDYRPAVVYVNGEFWGIQNIREKVNEHYIETHYGIEPDNLDLLSTISSTPDPELVHGSTEDYIELKQFISNNDLSIQSNYEYAASQYDVDNLIEYHIAQIFVMNFDWPGNNNKLFKSKSADGKWRHIMFDSDFGFERWTDLVIGYIGSYESYNMLDHAYGDGNVFNNPTWATSIFTSFLDNPGFREQFINTYCDRINTTYSTENTTYLMDSLKTIIEPYVLDHINRYGPNIYDTYTPNNISQYNSAIQLMTNFASYRPDNARNEMVEIFDLDGTSNNISIYTNDIEMGYVRLNSLNINKQGWSGKYFSDVPITIKAIPKFGYEFSHWSGLSSLEDSVILYLDEPINIIANYIETTNPYQNLIAINEINYNSDDNFDSGDWIELYNYSDQNIDLSRWSFLDEDDSHVYAFNDSLTLEAGGYLVLCQDSTSFSNLYTEVNNFIGDLGFGFSGGGELLRLLDSSGVLIDVVEYDDSDPWPSEPDGNGATLELINPELDNSQAASWSSSISSHGTPGMINSTFSSLASQDNNLLPTVFELYQNYPNPFNPLTSIKYDLPKDEHTFIAVFDIMGRHVKTLVDNNQSAGYKTVKWDATNTFGKRVAAGMYIYQIKAGTFNASKKMILLK